MYTFAQLSLSLLTADANNRCSVAIQIKIVSTLKFICVHFAIRKITITFNY